MTVELHARHHANPGKSRASSLLAAPYDRAPRDAGEFGGLLSSSSTRILPRPVVGDCSSRSSLLAQAQLRCAWYCGSNREKEKSRRLLVLSSASSAGAGCTPRPSLPPPSNNDIEVQFDREAISVRWFLVSDFAAAVRACTSNWCVSWCSLVHFAHQLGCVCVAVQCTPFQAKRKMMCAAVWA